MLLKNNKQQIKIYTVMILAIILVISFYFRFIHAKVRDAGPGNYAESNSMGTINPPRFSKIKMPEIETSEPDEPEALETIIRDIFIPLVSRQLDIQPEINEAGIEPVTPRQPPSLKLRGTILSGKSAIAIINDQFLRLGDWIGEYRISQIMEREVVLASGDHKIRLGIYINE